MEAHHPHVHHSDKKKFRHYFYEFLMLFLAVFCGFLAEYQLEHKIEREREKQYVSSLIEDLATDTTRLSATLNEFDGQARMLDSVQLLFSGIDTGFNPVLFRNMGALFGFPDFIYSDRTMQQFKNSGGLRLIRNNKAAGAIAAYDSKVRDLGLDVETLGKSFEQLQLHMAGIIDWQSLDEESKKAEGSSFQTESPLLTTERSALGKLYNLIGYFRMNTRLVVSQEKELRQQAVELIALLKKEYRLGK